MAEANCKVTCQRNKNISFHHHELTVSLIWRSTGPGMFFNFVSIRFLSYQEKYNLVIFLKNNLVLDKTDNKNMSKNKQLVLQHCCETTCFAILPQKKLKSDGARFTNHIKPVLQKIRFVNRFEREWSNAHHRFSTFFCSNMAKQVARFCLLFHWRLSFHYFYANIKLLLFLLFSIRPSHYDAGRSTVIRNPMIKTEQDNTGENRRGGGALSSETFEKDQNQPIKVIHKFIYYYPCKEWSLLHWTAR